MNESEQKSFPEHDPFLRERIGTAGQQMPPMNRQMPMGYVPRKSKALAGILSFLLPGSGHLYLGLMQKGVTIMVLLALNIAAIPYFVINHHGSNFVPIIVLLGCMIPVIYFYNIFDALQSADKVNRYQQTLVYDPTNAGGHSSPYGSNNGGMSNGNIGLSLIVLGIAFFMFTSKPQWLSKLFDLVGSYVGAIVLIGVGIALFFKESRKK